MKMKLLALAVAGTLVSAPAMAAPTFAPFTINLSGTNAAAATYTYNFDAGNYTVSLIKDLYTAVAVSTPSSNNWVDYYQYSVDGGVTYKYAGTLSTRYATADDAFNAYSAEAPLSLSFASATAVTFKIGDSLNALGDNAGGTSLRVTSSAVPEPATWAMMFVGFGGMGFAMRRRASTSASLARG